MLAQIVLASFDGPQVPRKRGISGSGLSPCHYGNYITYHKLDPRDYVKRTPEEKMTMDDGWYQEAKALAHLKKAGFKMRFTGKQNQLELHMGRAKTTGHPDGLITVRGTECMLEIKGMNKRRFTKLKEKGLKGHMSIKTQVQGYLASDEFRLMDLPGCHIYAIDKETGHPYSLYEKYEPNFIEPILEVLDAIIIERFRPEKVESPLCADCFRQTFCWDTYVVDLSTLEVAILPEVADKWRLGTQYKTYGKLMVDEAREVLISQMGKKDILVCEGLKLKKITFDKSQFSQLKFVQLYGAESLWKVMDVNPVEQVRIFDVEKKD